MQQRVWICRALDDARLNIQLLTVVDRDISEIDLQQGQLRLKFMGHSARLLTGSNLSTTEAKKIGMTLKRAHAAHSRREHETSLAVYDLRAPRRPGVAFSRFRGGK